MLVVAGCPTSSRNRSTFHRRNRYTLQKVEVDISELCVAPFNNNNRRGSTSSDFDILFPVVY